MTTVTIGKRTFWCLIVSAIILQVLRFMGIISEDAVWALADLAGAVALIQSHLKGNKKEMVMKAVRYMESWIKSCLKCQKDRLRSNDLDIEKGLSEIGDREIELVTVNYLPQISIE